uniref:Uncharacterized protein n=2 Tax=Araneus ventricosus TaxID=182803 RepID=A0A4Y2J204_ARAVE|nr:hypothetical protein AVEN_24085-1 [Araneus ventricosus]GBM84241.1 hypothetical protein AVEN_48356-1 [Araneus ventricosus]
MWMYGNLESNWTKKTTRNYKSGFALTVLFQLEKDCDLVSSKWGYRQCEEDDPEGISDPEYKDQHEGYFGTDFAILSRGQPMKTAIDRDNPHDCKRS